MSSPSYSKSTPHIFDITSVIQAPIVMESKRKSAKAAAPNKNPIDSAQEGFNNRNHNGRLTGTKRKVSPIDDEMCRLDTRFTPVNPADYVPTKAKDLSHLRMVEKKIVQPFYIPPVVQVPKCKKPRPAPPGAKVHPTEEILGCDSQHSYVLRWIRMLEEERNGSVQFVVLKNDGKRESLERLLGIKNVFVKQLPNMPRPYVSRLVFDRKHESVALLKKENEKGDYTVMGGCCYRPFYEQEFAEIAFLAISQTQRVRGYGTRLMAHTKQKAKSTGIKYFLTCADNDAIPYFKKQGFSTKITLPFEKWQGYIKDYDGVTLMECVIHENIDSLNIPMMLKAQKMALVEKLKEISNSHIVFPGINFEGKKSLKPDEIPGLKALTGANRQARTLGFSDRDETSQEILREHLKNVLDELMSANCAWPFTEPVNAIATGATDYYDVIKNPIDLGTIKRKLDEGWFYVTKELFLADLKRMVENCITYNGKGHDITKLALNLEKMFLARI